MVVKLCLLLISYQLSCCVATNSNMMQDHFAASTGYARCDLPSAVVSKPNGYTT